jgi:hypothetical protein
VGEIEDAQVRVARSVDEIRSALASAGLKYVDVGGHFMGTGVAVAWADTFFAVLSVANFVDQQFSITYGVLRDVQRDKPIVLEYCNQHNQGFAAYPVYLHDAENGWDILQQNVLPMQILRDAPDFVLGFYMGGSSQVVEDLREKASEVGLGGLPYQWTEEDAGRLLARSLI